jgi:hypothetical protein
MPSTDETAALLGASPGVGGVHADALPPQPKSNRSAGRHRWTFAALTSLALAGLCALAATRHDASRAGVPVDVHETAASVSQLPDFGADTLSLESVMERLGVNTTSGLTELTVDYAGVKITGNVYAKLFDEPWLQRLPLISWPEFMDGPDDPARFTVVMFDADATFGMQGVDAKKGKRDQTFLHALWTDCRGGSTVECGAQSNMRAKYLMPAPSGEEDRHQVVFLLLRQGERPDGLDEVRFWLRTDQLYRRENRVHELLAENPHLEPKALTYMWVDGKH